MAESIHVSWEATDGYIGGARPQSTRINPHHFDPADTDQQIADTIRECVEDDFKQIVTFLLSDAEVAKAVAAVRSAIGKEE